jgi:hypothetical protein
MSATECPIKWGVECSCCPYSKESLCDYPYILDAIVVVSGDDIVKACEERKI